MRSSFVNALRAGVGGFLWAVDGLRRLDFDNDRAGLDHLRLLLDRGLGR